MQAYDAWSFGVVLFELCTGRALFKRNVHDDVMPAEYMRLCLWLDVSDAELEGVFSGACPW